MSTIICVLSQKGGVGKTTATINLGAALALKGSKVLIIDNDPQANSTNALGFDDEALEHTIYELLTDNVITKQDIVKVIHNTKYKDLDLIPADITLADAEIRLSSALSRETILKKMIKHIDEDYDFIFIDCPPSLGLISINGLVAADMVIIPVFPSSFSVKGIRHLSKTVSKVKEALNPDLRHMVLITKYDSRTKMSHDYTQRLKDSFGDNIFKTIIRVNAEIEYAQGSSTPIVHYNLSCNGSEDYLNLAEEVIENVIPE